MATNKLKPYEKINPIFTDTHFSKFAKSIINTNIIMKTGIELIAQERAEQIEKHYITVESDVKENEFHQLVAASIMLLGGFPHKDEYNHTPFKWDKLYFNRMMQKPEIDRLKIAGALIAAEIDRIQYVTK